MAELSLGGPLAAFQIGQQIGETNSPVSGIGQSIRNILDTARKKGLLQAQSQFQAEGSNQVNIAKEARATERSQETIPLNIIGPGGAIRRETTTREAKNIREPAQTLSGIEQITNLIEAGGNAGVSKGTPAVQTRIDELKQTMSIGEITRFLVEKGLNPEDYNL